MGKKNYFRVKKGMKISVEISYYPLNESYIPPIQDFINRVKQHTSIEVFTNGMSTQVFGDYDQVFDILKQEIRASFDLPHSIFVMKVINGYLK